MYRHCVALSRAALFQAVLLTAGTLNLTATLPADSSFPASIENLLTPAVFAIFKPVLAVVAYVDIVDADGHSSSEMQATGYIPPSDKNDFPPAPGKDMLFTADRRYGGEAICVMREGITQPEERLEHLARQPPANYVSAASITFVLDAIVLADGTFIGPDKPHAYGGLVSRLATEAPFLGQPGAWRCGRVRAYLHGRGLGRIDVHLPAAAVVGVAQQNS